jgi:hypothetical protein
MLRCASSFLAATYGQVRLAPQDSRALPAELFSKSSFLEHFSIFLNSSLIDGPEWEYQNFATLTRQDP